MNENITLEGKIVYVLENVEYDEINHKISGIAIEGPYEGNVEIYLPETLEMPTFEEKDKIRAYCGEGMTMSLPPQLMGCVYVEIVE